MWFGFSGRELEAATTGTLQVPGPDRHWLTGQVHATNRAGICRDLTEVLNSRCAEQASALLDLAVQ
ncbi:MAG: hypothetical protein M3Z25_20380 [Actinomycetota bacterium]|nr:hypothetical protein [Actinomycetota bacterium]